MNINININKSDFRDSITFLWISILFFLATINIIFPFVMFIIKVVFLIIGTLMFLLGIITMAKSLRNKNKKN